MIDRMNRIYRIKFLGIVRFGIRSILLILSQFSSSFAEATEGTKF
jgi:hypothetical protein